jgi:PBP1b-binding outer membrane lipoprotein LpoB
MKKLFSLLLPVLFLSGCVSIKDPVMLNKSFPSGDKYEILGGVAVKGKQYVFLTIAWGGIDWTDLRSEAVRIYGRERRVDDVVSVSLDEKVSGVIGILIVRQMVMSGTAIRYINEPSMAR